MRSPQLFGLIPVLRRCGTKYSSESLHGSGGIEKGFESKGIANVTYE